MEGNNINEEKRYVEEEKRYEVAKVERGSQNNAEGGCCLRRAVEEEGGRGQIGVKEQEQNLIYEEEGIERGNSVPASSFSKRGRRRRTGGDSTKKGREEGEEGREEHGTWYSDFLLAGSGDDDRTRVPLWTCSSFFRKE